jgi:hypothetical protein
MQNIPGLFVMEFWGRSFIARRATAGQVTTDSELIVALLLFSSFQSKHKK